MIDTSDDIQANINALPIAPEYQNKFETILTYCKQNLPQYNEEMLRQAFRLSYWAHRHDKRASGEPYISHPLEVAQIVAKDIRSDDVSVAAALMHDVVEDTEINLPFIREVFGKQMEQIIDGLTKIEGVFDSREIGRAENARKLIISMASDMRVILVKFADRLHNMRTLGSFPERKQRKIASDTLDFFIPLAHRFGLFAIKGELEDLCLKAMDRESFNAIASGLDQKKKQRDLYIQRFIEPIKKQLEEAGFSFTIKGRSKSIHSIYNKMKTQQKTLNEIYDLFAIRIILNTEGKKGKEECWRVYSIITDSYKPLPDRFRDFISMPKSNGYQSLHTTVLGHDGKRVEVQIRTKEMDDVAERGIAAHWKYKEGVSGKSEQIDKWFTWVREVLESPQSGEATEFVNDFRLDLFDEEIYVFSPRGDVLTLPKGATPVDFAFQIHTQVGFHCTGAKINSKMVPLSTKLESGDQVEIITSSKQTPNPDWIKFVITSKARTRIRHWINEQRREVVNKGKEVWQRKLKKSKHDVDEQQLNRIAKQLKFPNTQQMFYEIGQGLLNVTEVLKLVRKKQKTDEKPELTDAQLRAQYETFIDTAQQQGKDILLINGEEQKNIKVSYASCCNPIPGDSVFGFVSSGKGIRIHRAGCKNSKNLHLHEGRIVDIEWSRQKDARFIAALKVIGEDHVGMVNDITSVISKALKTNIRSLSISTTDGLFEGNIVLDVSDVEHLRLLINRLMKIEGVHGVYRYEE